MGSEESTPLLPNSAKKHCGFWCIVFVSILFFILFLCFGISLYSINVTLTNDISQLRQNIIQLTSDNTKLHSNLTSIQKCKNTSVKNKGGDIIKTDTTNYVTVLSTVANIADGCVTTLVSICAGWADGTTGNNLVFMSLFMDDLILPVNDLAYTGTVTQLKMYYVAKFEGGVHQIDVRMRAAGNGNMAYATNCAVYVTTS